MLNRSARLVMSTSILKALAGNLISNDTHLVFSISQQASRCQQAFSKLCMVNLISKDTHLVFSIYVPTNETKIGFPDKLSLSEGFKYCRML